MAYSKTEKRIIGLAEPVAKELDFYLYDVEYIKEGGIWFLRVYVDKKEGGISIDECENFSRALSDVLDKEDPIVQNYYLEVSSPGIERKLKTKEHFETYMGQMVDVGLYKAIDGAKQLTGKLVGYEDEKIKIQSGDKEHELNLSDTTVVHLHFEW